MTTYNVKAAAERLGIKKSAVYKALSEGRLIRPIDDAEIRRYHEVRSTSPWGYGNRGGLFAQWLHSRGGPSVNALIDASGMERHTLNQWFNDRPAGRRRMLELAVHGMTFEMDVAMPRDNLGEYVRLNTGMGVHQFSQIVGLSSQTLRSWIKTDRVKLVNLLVRGINAESARDVL